MKRSSPTYSLSQKLEITVISILAGWCAGSAFMVGTPLLASWLNTSRPVDGASLLRFVADSYWVPAWVALHDPALYVGIHLLMIAFAFARARMVYRQACEAGPDHASP